MHRKLRSSIWKCTKDRSIFKWYIFLQFVGPVLWCSGYHVCFTRRRSRVRTSPEPLDIFVLRKVQKICLYTPKNQIESNSYSYNIFYPRLENSSITRRKLILWTNRVDVHAIYQNLLLFKRSGWSIFFLLNFNIFHCNSFPIYLFRLRNNLRTFRVLCKCDFFYFDKILCTLIHS